MGNTQVCRECSNISEDPAIYSNPTITNTKTRAINLTNQNSSIIIPTTTQSNSHKQISEGISKISFMGGIVYTGQVNNNIREGTGKQVWPDGSIYEGSWSNDKMNGQGKFISNKVECEGTFANNNFIKGVMLVKGVKTQKYTGELKNHMYHGNGELVIQGKQTYKGSFKNHLKDGWGILTQENGDYYEGGFQAGLFEGQGVYRTSNYEYIGSFSNGKFNGQGFCKWKNGTYYKGGYVNWLKEGYGEYKDSKDHIYKGFWKNGKPIQDYEAQSSLKNK